MPESVSDGQCLTPEQQREMLVARNHIGVDYPQGGAVLHELIELQVKKTPEAIAVRLGETQLTYQMLDTCADRLACLLRCQGIGPDSLVGVIGERSPELLIGLMGILKAGGAYVPLDPDYPQERLSLMIEDAGITSLVVPKYLQTRFADLIPSLVVLADIWAWETEAEDKVDLSYGLPENLAYVIYTSGSTGQPKGAMNTHRAICNRLLWMQQTYNLQATDHVLQKTSLSFDVSVWECFWPLLTGAVVVLAEPGGQRDSAYLVHTIQEQAITTLHFVPSLLHLILQDPHIANCTSLRRVICSGEALSFELEQRCFAILGAQLSNLYGPTEAAIDVTYWICEQEAHPRPVPIGHQIANIQIYILDQSLQPVAPGEAGELFIAGIGLARGYLRRPDLTAERFLPNPFSSRPGTRLYRTGDLARYRTDGAIEFLGRLDEQVKIRGFRVEPGEVQAVLAQHPAVEQTVVVSRENRPGEHSLAAYIVPSGKHASTIRQLLAFQQEGVLKGLLVHMLPGDRPILCLNRSEVDFLVREIFETQEYLRSTVRLHDGDCVFDVGANIGLFTLFAEQLHQRLSIYAFEPVEPVFTLLRLNTRLYSSSAKLFNYGLSWKSQQDVPFVYYPHCSILSGRFADESDYAVVKAYIRQQQEDAGLSEELLNGLLENRLERQTVPCQLKTLSEVLNEEHVEQIDLLKIDVEKSEMDVLAGIREDDWSKIRQIVVEVHDVEGRREQVVEILQRHGYTLDIRQASLLDATPLCMIYAVRQTDTPLDNAGEASLVPEMAEQRWLNPRALLNNIRAFLQAKLPGYMLPDDIVLLNSLPLNPNDKLDRKALPAPARVHQFLADVTYQAPRTVLESKLADLWGEYLGITRLGIQENFFQLGGHSLLAMQVVTRMHTFLEGNWPLRALFDHPTIAEFARYVEEQKHQSAQPLEGPLLEAFAQTRDARQDLPLSYAQESVWFFQQLDPGSRNYQFQATLHFSGPLQIEALCQSLNEIVRRHEIYRTTFPAIQGTPIQHIHAHWDAPLPLVDLEALFSSPEKQHFNDLLGQFLQHQFDITRLPLVQWILLRQAPEKHILLHIEHHLVHDGWSFNRLVRELQDFYRYFSTGQPIPAIKPALQFADFACWQRQWMQSKEAERQLAYWCQRLANAPPVLQLPSDYPRPHVQHYQGDALRLQLPGDLCAALRTWSRQSGVTLFMFCLTAFLVLLYRYSGQSDICIGTGLANRRQAGSENLLGMLVNTIALRFDLANAGTFRTLLEQVRQVCLDAYECQEMPFTRVVEALQPERSSGHTPLYQVLFSFHDAPLPKLDFPGLQVNLEEGLSNRSSKADLNIILIPRVEQQVNAGSQSESTEALDAITLIWEYNSDLFTEATMRRMQSHFQTLLRMALADPEQSIITLPLMEQEEIARLLVLGRDVQQSPAEARDICALIEQQAREIPDALALVSEAGCLTYRALNSRANQLARYLRQFGVGPDIPVGIFLERSLEMVIAALGVLKASGAYITLDPTLPPAHRAFLLQDAAIPLLLSRERLRDQLFTHNVRLCYLDSDWPMIASQPVTNPPVDARLDHLAYLIYTSGSTGYPKGVQLTRQGLANLVQWHLQAFALSSNDRATHLAGLSFDASVWELWPYLTSGACLCLVDDETRLSSALLTRYLSLHAITLSFLPTPLAERFLQEQTNVSDLALRQLLVGGDVLHCYPAAHIPFSVVNNYGPAENTVVATSCRVSPEAKTHALPPIGSPISQVEVLILDARLRPVPAGVPGELCIGGPGLARGYLGLADLTAEKFIPHPYSSQPGARLYRTGDRARFGANGEIEFLGREDFQVKIRGFRIELEEIEVILTQHPQIQEAVVIAHDSGHDERQLIAFFKPFSPGLSPTPGELRQFLRVRLPHYMVPAAFIAVEAFPLSPGGKIMRQALPVPEPGQGVALAASRKPATSVERELARIWAMLLSLDEEQIGIDDDFFALGGHSLLVTRALTLMLQSFQVSMPLATLFEQPTIGEQASLVLALQLAGQAQEKQGLWLEELQLLSDEEALKLALKGEEYE